MVSRLFCVVFGCVVCLQQGSAITSADDFPGHSPHSPHACAQEEGDFRSNFSLVGLKEESLVCYFVSALKDREVQSGLTQAWRLILELPQASEKLFVCKKEGEVAFHILTSGRVPSWRKNGDYAVLKEGWTLSKTVTVLMPEKAEVRTVEVKQYFYGARGGIPVVSCEKTIYGLGCNVGQGQGIQRGIQRQGSVREHEIDLGLFPVAPPLLEKRSRSHDSGVGDLQFELEL